MTQGQPQTRASELLAEINRLSAKDRDNEFLLKRLERESRQLLKTSDSAFGFVLLGALAAVRQDESQTRAFHVNALAIEPRNPYVLRNYAISLYRLGFLDDAIAMARRAWDLDKTRKDNLSLLLELTCAGGRMQDAAQYVGEAELTPSSGDTADITNAEICDIRDAASLLAERGITDAAAGAIARVALGVVPPLTLDSIENRVSADDESRWVDFALKVNGSAEKVMELNMTFAERMAELTLDSEIGKASAAFIVRFTRNTGMDAGNLL